VQLGLKEPESVSDELDPREIGTAAHAALELVALRGAWAHEGERDAVIEAFTHDLRSANKPAFDQARERFGALSPARRLATDGLEARWSEHWSLYARNRARKALDVTDRTAAENLVYSHRWVDAAVDALLQRGRTEGLPELTPMALRYWVKDASEAAQTGESLASDDQLLHPGGRNGLPAAWVNVARSFVDGVEFKRVVSIWATAKDLSRALTAPTVATAAELPFGTSEHVARVGTLQAEEPAAIGPIRVQFGKRDLALTGSIDRVSLVGEAGAALLRVIDYKSGTVAPDDREARDRVRRLVEPQLVVYALVLRQALREGRLTGPFAGSKVASVGWDFLRATDDQRALQPSREVLLDEATLDELARAIGALVQRATDGQWSLSPLPDTCPELGAWRHDHCPFAGACRLRAVPRSSTAEAP
jgi:hypothetical protein